jgi:predicted amidohydrolase
MGSVSRSLSLVVLILFAAGVSVPAEDHGADDSRAGEVTVVSVQFEVTEARYATLDTYRAAVSKVVRTASQDPRVDLVVFPEYINVPVLFSEYRSVLNESESIDGALELILGREASSASLRELILHKAEELHPDLLEMWSGLAHEFGVSLLPGTFFVSHREGTSRQLRNRVVLFDESGERIYRQDKVFLTVFERDRLGMSPGTVDAAHPVSIEGLDVGVTVCRDSYFEEWDAAFRGVELWIDLRANGERYTPEVRERFSDTLPERVRSVGASAGINASLTGSYLDLLWEGPSYLVGASGNRTAETPDVVGTSLLVLTVNGKAGALKAGITPPKESPQVVP